MAGAIFIHPIVNGLRFDIGQEISPGGHCIRAQKSHHPTLVDRFIETVGVVWPVFYPLLATYGSNDQVGCNAVNGETDCEDNQPTFNRFNLELFNHDHWTDNRIYLAVLKAELGFVSELMMNKQGQGFNPDFASEPSFGSRKFIMDILLQILSVTLSNVAVL